MSIITIFLISCLAVTIVVLIHYEALSWLGTYLPEAGIKHRYRIVVGVLGSLVVHAVEVWVFALLYYTMHHAAQYGSLTGNFSGTLLEAAYFSFTTYTTLGFGDIQPVGDIRYLTGIESLTGLVLITWTASFLYLEMQRSWFK